MLLEKLREARPLVEWPEPAAPSDPALAGDAGPQAASVSLGSSAPTETLSAPDGSAPDSVAQSLDPFAAGQKNAGQEAVFAVPLEVKNPGASASGQSPFSAAARAAGGDDAPPSGIAPASRLAGQWIPPGHPKPPAPAAPRGVNPTILVAVSGLMVLGVGIAYLAGRASSGAPAPSANAGAPAPSAISSARRRGGGPAGRAAQVFTRSLAHVAKACEVPLFGEPESDVLASAFAQCGPQPLGASRDGPRRPQAITHPAPRDPEPPPSPPPREGGDRPTDPPPSGGGSCIGGCDVAHKSCRSSCGPEPKQSSLYGGYQDCLGKCLSRASSCRRNCN